MKERELKGDWNAWNEIKIAVALGILVCLAGLALGVWVGSQF